MNLEAYIGFKCPYGHEKVNVGVGVPRCSKCGTQMVPDNTSPPVAVNVKCTKCDTFYGMINSAVCPDCGRPWS